MIGQTKTNQNLLFNDHCNKSQIFTVLKKIVPSLQYVVEINQHIKVIYMKISVY